MKTASAGICSIDLRGVQLTTGTSVAKPVPSAYLGAYHVARIQGPEGKRMRAGPFGELCAWWWDVGGVEKRVNLERRSVKGR